jgi:hypothetical protein
MVTLLPINSQRFQAALGFESGFLGYQHAIDLAASRPDVEISSLVADLMVFAGDWQTIFEAFIVADIPGLSQVHDAQSIRRILEVSQKARKTVMRSLALLARLTGNQKAVNEATRGLTALTLYAQNCEKAAEEAILRLEQQAESNPFLRALINAPISDDPEDDWDHSEDSDGWSSSISIEQALDRLRQAVV